ncbi:hypothetical protein CCDG5_0938 [[Clostridium] cellulosi]|jgi:2'-5' RNA ligase|uniref:RNA 2',3'-cyclic phosphodiesterase n=1 Tax=[Clostridium] cellulosi TaxID=29343 RepID=A0A078KNG8_9FIRM|nr:MAG: RNA 2',3'-cyclic phosphodiesterase [[Clostridium] cellulosi]CDZ24057.1 hypothetical protein CCDG5_0938 [[Clostridium] cellulosi]
MRLFAAISFDENTKNLISELYNKLDIAGVKCNFTPVSNLHLTLKFLGETDNSRLNSIKSALNEAAQIVSCFDIVPDKLGYFPSRSDKTIWLGMKGNGLESLAAAVDESLSKVGYEKEKRKFTPHVTLARRALCDKNAISDIEIPDFVFRVSAVTLFESRRDNGRLWYKPLYLAYLKN